MIKLLNKYLKSRKFDSQINAFEDAFLSHPNYPSLLAITDSLTQLEIENIAAKVPFKHIDKLPKSFIAELFVDKKEYYIVSEVNNYFILENEIGIKRNINHADLEKFWTGIILMIEINENNNQKNILSKANYFLPLLLVAFCLLHLVGNSASILEYTFLSFSALGVFVSLEIVKTYLSDKSENESKFCTANTNFSCKSIISSKAYSFSKYLEFVDLPIIFFSIAFLAQILSLNVLFYIGSSAVLAVPFLFYSIYLQKFVLKKWCFLCLIIAFIILIIGVVFVVNYASQQFVLTSIIPLLILTVLVIFIWFLAKKKLQQSKENQQALKKLLRFKHKENVFTKIATAIDNKSTFDSLQKITIGKVEAKNTLTLFLSPSCPHCHRAYKQAINLISKHTDKLKLEICFNLNISNQDNPFVDVARNMFQLYNANKEFKEALDDWHIKKMPLKQWLERYSFRTDFTNENIQIENQYKWCTENGFSFAPVKIFNSLILPDVYEIDELFYFFNE